MYRSLLVALLVLCLPAQALAVPMTATPFTRATAERFSPFILCGVVTLPLWIGLAVYFCQWLRERLRGLRLPWRGRVPAWVLVSLCGLGLNCAEVLLPLAAPKVQLVGPGSYRVQITYPGAHIDQADHLLQQYGAQEGERLCGAASPSAVTTALDPGETKEGPPPPSPKKEPKDGEDPPPPPPKAITIVSGTVMCPAPGPAVDHAG